MAAVSPQLEPPPFLTLEARAAELGRAHARVLPGRAGRMQRRLATLDHELRDVYRRLEARPPAAARPGYAAEWLLDNRHVIGEALLQVKESLPRRNERELPRLADGPRAGEARVTVAARELLAALEGQPDLERMRRFLLAYQEEAPLSMRELWALPVALRLIILEGLVESCGELLEREPEGAGADPTDVATAVLALRTLAAQDWRPFFEAVSRVERALLGDPAGAYGRMDSASRDRFRSEVERLTRRTRDARGEEERVAKLAVELAAREAQPRDTVASADPADVDPRSHVGYFLLGPGREQLVHALGGPAAAAVRLREGMRRRAEALYLASVLSATALPLAACVLYAAAFGAPAWAVAVVAVLAVIPCATVAVSVVNWIVTHVVEPRTLPKLDFTDGIPEPCRTVVVVPCILTGEADVLEQLRELEVNFLGNAHPHVSFGLLSDFPDARVKELPEDVALIDFARAGVRELNRRHASGDGGSAPFFLLHRERRWNAREASWMGWERKRGKLEELNQLLLGSGATSFVVHEGHVPAPGAVRYVITVDADTFLPPGTVTRLVGTMAHPLNRPVLEADGEVRSGYTVLQPRLEVTPETRTGSLFSRVFEADRAIDLYTHAVSDVYQDVAGEGSYAGKGIYDVAAFAASLAGRAPENTLLSHDLIEGLQGRAGLVTDVTLFEQYPTHVLTYMRRLHRWIRGDWQILPWLGDRVPLADGNRAPTRLGLLDRWKIVDNLRRSLLAPALLALLGTAWLALPRPAFWTALVLVVLGTPVLLQGAATVNRVARARRTPPRAGPHGWQWLRPAVMHAVASLRTDVARWGLAVAFLAYEAVVVTDAIVRSLWRMWISRRRLLEWTTAAHSARAVEDRGDVRLLWRQMWPAPAIGFVAIAAAAVLRPEVLPLVLPIALLWAVSPQIAYVVSRPRPARQPERLAPGQRRELRMLARRTWLFFQNFVGPQDHWLPPDNFQEEPGGIIARRTSPTNVGFSLLSTLAAYDLGYIGPIALAASLRNTLETLEKLDRHRGHFLNWYDTRTLEPLPPRYVSTVDSGNLAAALLTVARGVSGVGRGRLLRLQQPEGFLDTLAHLPAVLSAIEVPELGREIDAVEARVAALRRRLVREVSGPGAWAELLDELGDRDLPALEDAVVELAEAGAGHLDAAVLRDLRIWTGALRDDVGRLRREVDALLPWHALWKDLPSVYRAASRAASTPAKGIVSRLLDRLGSAEREDPDEADATAATTIGDGRDVLRDAFEEFPSEHVTDDATTGGDDAAAPPPAPPLTRALIRLATELPDQTRLNEIPRVCRRALAALGALEALLEGDAAADPALAAATTAEREEARAWAARLRQALTAAADEARRLATDLRDVGRRCEALAGDMHFGFLYDPRRSLFHIGYNASMGELDANYYDLLASEARLASFLAIAQGDVRAEHWLHLGRPFARVEGRRSLLSWGGTMFEFLMPPLLMRMPEGTLLAESGQAAIERQIAWAARWDVPWGVSESGFARLDPQGNYEYRAFGVPGLGLKRDLGDRMVIAPYASLLALPFRPRQVAENFARLRRRGMVGRYGFYEALDLGRPGSAGQGIVVRSYMAHHQGMVLVALDNHLAGFPMVERFHAHPHVVTVEHLLHEQVPWHAPVLVPAAADGGGPPAIPRPAGLRVWRAHAHFPIPQTHVLSNGRYTVLLTAAGGGQSRWRGRAITRWRADATTESWGSWIYVQDLQDGSLTSAGFAPTGGDPDGVETWFAPHLAELHRRQAGISIRTLITVPPGDDVEIRHVRLVNETDRPRRLALVSYAEVCLAPQEADRRHPAFNKLFVESEAWPQRNALFFRRRARAADEEPVRMAHAVLPARSRSRVTWETDRARFLGRWGSPRRPAALASPGGLSCVTGATLDPVAALRCEVELGAHGDAEVVFLTIAGASRNDVQARLESFTSPARVQWAFQQARSHAELELHELAIPPARVQPFQELLSGVLNTGHALRDPTAVAANRLSRRELWRHGLSGDLPILLVRIGDADAAPLVAEVLQAHAWWRRRDLKIDLVLLTEEPGGYAQPVRDRVSALVQETGGGGWLNQRGGIFVISTHALDPPSRTQLEAAAAVVLDAAAETLDGAISRLGWAPPRLPAFVPVPSGPFSDEVATPPVERPGDLLFDNGWGGFTPDGREYVVWLPRGGAQAEPTPAPWVNVVAQPDFGFVASEAGTVCTWSGHSAENRLTPWRNDPVADEPGEAVYLRDEETAQVWSPTPLPAGTDAPYRVRHGAGYTVFEHASHGLEQELRVFVAPDAPVKLATLRLRNVRERPRRITATWYAEWVLGESREVTAWHVTPEYDHETGALLARNSMNEVFGARVAFLVGSAVPHGVTADRTEFLGRNGDLRVPAALFRIGLSGRVAPCDDPCAVLQVHVDLGPGEEGTLHFALGQGADREEALALAARFRDGAAVASAWEATRRRWDDVLDAVTVRTPDPVLDLMLNRWLPYQTLSCRFWGRTALYQSSGAFGFRDQLQDVLALLHVRPELARAHLLESARHQFEEGDVLHWWHPPSGAGVRTRCSDDLLWLPYAVAAYIEATGDVGVLEQEVPFLTAPPLARDEEDRYAEFPESHGASLYEHCLRALARGSTAGPHGLPLIGAHDWNDGLSRVGREGRGESVWLAWFLIDCLRRFAGVCERLGEGERAADLRERAERVHEAAESAGWDGAWYRRAYYDDGSPLGSSANREARIDSIAQTWSVLSGAGDEDRVRAAMRSLEELLVRPLDGEAPPLLPLFWPPFDRTQRDPGYVKGYPPGVRENGGQYNHAAAWAGWAHAAMGQGEKALADFRAIVPVLRAGTRPAATRYAVEPYVTAADVYSAPPHVGRGGWTWYTGSAGWTYRLGLEAILGIRREDGWLRLAPRIPPGWPGFEVRYRCGTATYRIVVENGGGSEVTELVLDGASLEGARFPLADDGRTHEVRARLG